MNNKRSSLTNRKSGKKFPDFFLCLFLILPFSFFAQQMTVMGYVINRADGTPVPDVQINIKTDAGTFFFVKTDSLGDYNFTLDRSKFQKAEFYTQTTKDNKTPTATLGFLFTGPSHKINSTDTVKGKYVFPLIRIEDCYRPHYNILFKFNSTAFIDSVFSRGFNDEIVYGKPVNDVDVIYKVLADNPTIVIELSGHCSSNETKEGLSGKRASLVKQMLVAKGVDPIRIVDKGYGTAKLKVTDAQIKKAKTKEEKDALHQINRRVVYKTLNWDHPGQELPKDFPKTHPQDPSDIYPGN
jgi:hypothetical protein